MFPEHNAENPFQLLDQAFLELAGRALPLDSPSPTGSVPALSAPPVSLEVPMPSRRRARRSLGDSISFFDGSVRETSASPFGFPGAGLQPGPTWAPRSRVSYRPIPPALQRPGPELSRLNALGRTTEALDSPPFQPCNPTRHASLHATLNSSRSAHTSNLHFHGLPNLAAAPNSRHYTRSDNLLSERHSRDLSRLLTLRRNLQQNTASDIAGPVHSGPAASPTRRQAAERAIPVYDSDGDNPRFPFMSSNARHRSLRPNDLTMPQAPSQAGPSSRSTAARAIRETTPRPSQPAKTSPATKRKREPDDDDLFGDDVIGDDQVVDLVDKDEVPAELLNSQKEDKHYVRLSAFDCVICMDSAKDLTVTHCGKAADLLLHNATILTMIPGHLFCSECLHSALNMDQTRRICPICRQKIDRLPAAGKFGPRAKGGFYPLELKLVSRATLGKRPDQPSGAAV